MQSNNIAQTVTYGKMKNFPTSGMITDHRCLLLTETASCVGQDIYALRPLC